MDIPDIRAVGHVVGRIIELELRSRAGCHLVTSERARELGAPNLTHIESTPRAVPC